MHAKAKAEPGYRFYALSIIGNTVSGIEDGKSYTEYYQPDGYVHGLELEGPYVGEWRIAGRNASMSSKS